MVEKKGLKKCPFCDREVEEGILNCPYCNRIYRLSPANGGYEEKLSPDIKKSGRLKAAGLTLLFLLVVSFLVYFFLGQRERAIPEKDLITQKAKDVIPSVQKIPAEGIIEEDSSENKNEKEPSSDKPLESLEKVSKSEDNGNNNKPIATGEAKVAGSDKITAFTHYKKGISLRREGKWDLAKEEFSKSINLNPSAAWAHYGLGIVYLQKGMDDEAMKEFEEALKFNPKIALANYQIGKIYQKREELDKAIREFQKAVEIDANFLWAHYRLAEIYRKKGEEEQAKKELEIYENLKESGEQIGE